MTNSDVLRRIRYIFDYGDDKMIKLFSFGDLEVTRAQVSQWLKRDDDEDYKLILDKELVRFLDGFIIEKRGRREGAPPPVYAKKINNNGILRKMKIAFKLTDEDMVKIFDLVDFEVSKHEINAFFRKPTQRQYRQCKDQFLRMFFFGLEKKYKVEKPKKQD